MKRNESHSVFTERLSFIYDICMHTRGRVNDPKNSKFLVVFFFQNGNNYILCSLSNLFPNLELLDKYTYLNDYFDALKAE